MASRLEQLLEPGERVLYRDPPARLPHSVPSMVMLAAMFATIFVTGTGHPLQIWFWSFALFLVVGVVVSLVPWSVDLSGFRSAETLITNHRILWWRIDSDSQIKQIAVPDVEEIMAISSAGLTIKTSGGKEFPLHVLRKPEGFAEALARAAQLPPPPSAGHLATLGNFGITFGGPACLILMFLLFGSALPDLQQLVGVADWAIALLGLAAVFWASYIAGIHATWMLGLVILRPWVTAGEATTWLRQDPGSGWTAVLVRCLTWQNPVYFALARRLYGLPFGPQGTEGHG